MQIEKCLIHEMLMVSQGFWGTREHWQNIEGNKGTLANFWVQGNKIRKITLRKHSERVWEHGNKGQFWKGTREQGPPPPPPGDPQCLQDVRNQYLKPVADIFLTAAIKTCEDTSYRVLIVSSSDC